MFIPLQNDARVISKYPLCINYEIKNVRLLKTLIVLTLIV